MGRCLRVNDDITKLAEEIEMSGMRTANLITMYYESYGVDDNLPSKESLLEFHRNIKEKKVIDTFVKTRIVGNIDSVDSLSNALGELAIDLLNSTGIPYEIVSHDELSKYIQTNGNKNARKNNLDQVYGWYDPNRKKLFFVKERLNPQTVAHEYTHLYFNVMQSVAPNMYNEWIQIAKEDSLWDIIKKSKEYNKDGKMSEQEIDHFIASEILSRYVGERTESITRASARFNGYRSKGNLTAKIKEFINKFFKFIKSMMNGEFDDKLNKGKYTKRGIVNSVTYDFLTSKNPMALITKAVDTAVKLEEQAGATDYNTKFNEYTKKGLSRAVAKAMYDVVEIYRQHFIEKYSNAETRDEQRLHLLNDINKGFNATLQSILRQEPKENILKNLKEVINSKSSIDDRIKTIINDYIESIYDDNDTNIAFKAISGSAISQRISEENDDDFDEEESSDTSAYGGKLSDKDPNECANWIKQLIGNLTEKKYDKDGKLVDDIDDFGPKLIDPAKAYAVLLNHFDQCILDSDDFAVKQDDGSFRFPTLEILAKQKDYAYIQSIIEAIKNDEQKVAGFYHNFYRVYMEYAGSTGSKIKTFNERNAVQTGKTKMFNSIQKGLLMKDNKSVFNADGDINTTFKQEITDIANKIRKTTDAEKIKSEDVVDFFKYFNIDVDEERVKELLKTKKSDIIKAVNAAMGILENGKDSNILNDINHTSRLNTIFGILGKVEHAEVEGSVRINGKPKYSYILSSYVTDMVRTLSNTIKNEDINNSNSAFQKYMQRFQTDSFFYDKENKRYLNFWLEALNKTVKTDTSDVIFDNSKLKIRNCIKMAGKYNSNPYNKMTAVDLMVTELSNFFQDKEDYSYYAMNIPSSSPNYMFIQGPRINDREMLIDKYVDLARQELIRIKRNIDRDKAKVTKIKNYDNNKEFSFLVKLNTIDINNKTLLDLANEAWSNGSTKNNGTLTKNIRPYIEKMLKEEFDEFINGITPLQNEIMHNYFVDKYRSEAGRDKKAKKVKTSNGENKSASNARYDKDTLVFDDNELEMLKLYFENRFIANAMIKQITDGDPSFYKPDNGVDEQKRAKQHLASGLKLFTNTTNGRKTSRVVYLKDEEIISSSYQMIKDSLNKAAKEGRITQSEADYYISKFDKINLADAQAYRSIDSYERILEMSGNLHGEVKRAIDNIKNGKWDNKDMYVVFQTLKPFVYTMTNIKSGIDKDDAILTPVQHKNSEFLILASMAMHSRDISKSQKLVGIENFMRKNNIDVVMFESALKVGNRKTLDIRSSQNKIDEFKDAHPEFSSAEDYDAIIKIAKGQLKKAKISQETYNEYIDALQPSTSDVEKIMSQSVTGKNKVINQDYGDEISLNDYMIAMQTPEHLFDAKVTFGSQLNQLIITNLPSDISVNIQDLDLNKEQVIELYRKLKTENIIDEYSKLIKKFDNIEELQKIIIETIDGNPKYDPSMKEAFDIVQLSDGTKVFKLPVDFPTYKRGIESILTSLFRNRITKQKISGANTILTANVGLNNDLKVKVDERTGRVEYCEVMLPFYSYKLFESLCEEKTDEHGNKYLTIDMNNDNVQKILDTDPEIFEGIAYRIPTEGKYSMIPFRIKGFLPENNGSSIMLPADIVAIAGSDFDVDKVFMMFYSLEYKYAKDRAYDYFIGNKKINKRNTTFEEWYEEHKEKYESEAPKFSDGKEKPTVGVKTFKRVKQDKGESDFDNIIRSIYAKKNGEYINDKGARDNMIVKIIYSILTNEKVSDQFFHPGNYKNLTVAGKFLDVTTDDKLFDKFCKKFIGKDKSKCTPEEIEERLSKIDDDEIKDFIKNNSKRRSTCSPLSYLYFHNQNMIGNDLIGIYANNITNVAKFQDLNNEKEDGGILKIYKSRIKLNGKALGNIDPKYDANGTPILNNLAEMSAAAVDNEKDPVCSSALQTRNSAKLTNLLLRLGVPIKDTVLFLGRPAVRKCIVELDLDKDAIKSYLEKLGTSEKDCDINSKESLERIMNKEEVASDVAMLIEILKVADELKDITLNSKHDSTNGAVGTTYNEVTESVDNVDNLVYSSPQGSIYGYHENYQTFENIEDVDDIDELREMFYKSGDPMGDAFYVCGVAKCISALSKHVISMGDKGRYVKNILKEQLGIEKTTSKMMDCVNKALTYYIYTKTDFFGKDYIKNRDYYLNDFPKEAKEFMKLHVHESDFLRDNIRVNKDNKIIINGPAAKSESAKKEFARQFLLMFKNTNPEFVEFGEKLIKYSFYKDALSFGHDSYSAMLTPEILLSIGTLSNQINEAIKEFNDGRISIPAFIDQLVRQSEFNDYIYNLKEDEYETIGGNDKFINIKKGIAHSEKDTTSKVLYVRIGDKVYKKDKDNNFVKINVEESNSFNMSSNDDIEYQMNIDNEMMSIKQQAIANGTFMKAPNGNRTNLNEQQWLQVRTKAFKNWFGDWENDPANASKVVDENREPLVVYHNSKSKIDEFDKNKIGTNGSSEGGLFGQGFYFSTNREYNSLFGNKEHAVFLDIKNPIKDEGTIQEIQAFNPSIDIIKKAYNKDGLIGINRYEKNTIEYVVYDPNQIKSATDNSGDFSSDNNNIYFQMNISDDNTADGTIEDSGEKVVYLESKSNDKSLSEYDLENTNNSLKNPLC